MSRILVPTKGVAVDQSYLFDDVQGAVGILALVTAVYTTGPTIGDRDIDLRIIGKSGNIIGVFATPVSQPASTSVRYVFGGTGTAYAGSNAGEGIVHIPIENVFLEGGDTIQLTDDGADSDDQWGAMMISIVGDQARV